MRSDSCSVVYYYKCFSYGALETVPLRQFSRRAAAIGSNRTSSVEKPKQIQNLEQQEEESTTKDVKHILSHLKAVCRENGGMEYHQFLVDPNSFSRTVENIFHFSFLIKVWPLFIVCYCYCYYYYRKAELESGEVMTDCPLSLFVRVCCHKESYLLQDYNYI